VKFHLAINSAHRFRGSWSHDNLVKYITKIRAKNVIFKCRTKLVILSDKLTEFHTVGTATQTIRF